MTDQPYKIPIITTPDLTLRGLEPTDAPALFAAYQTEGVLEYFPNPNPPPLEKIARFIGLQTPHWQKYHCGNWGLTLKDDPASTVFGWAGLQVLPELGETEVGYLLGRPWWGKGYATQAARASVAFGFAHLDVPYLIALIAPDNLASRRVAAKCGFVYHDTLELWGMTLMRHRLERRDFLSAD